MKRTSLAKALDELSEPREEQVPVQVELDESLVRKLKIKLKRRGITLRSFYDEMTRRGLKELK